MMNGLPLAISNSLFASSYSAWLLHKDENLWLRQWVFFGMPLMTSVGVVVFGLLAGIASFFVNIVSSTILLLIVWQIRATG
jgi:hypothetical protein